MIELKLYVNKTLALEIAKRMMQFSTFENLYRTAGIGARASGLMYMQFTYLHYKKQRRNRAFCWIL